jgi:hypothetical protein
VVKVGGDDGRRMKSCEEWIDEALTSRPSGKKEGVMQTQAITITLADSTGCRTVPGIVSIGDTSSNRSDLPLELTHCMGQQGFERAVFELGELP